MEREKKICEICGKEFVPKSAVQKLCSNECRAISNSNRAKERKRLIAEGKYVYPKHELHKVVCIECGKEFETDRRASCCYCSDECRKIAFNRQQRERYERDFERQKKQKAEKPKKPRKGSLMRAEREARKKGMSYGQYKAMLYMQQNDEVGKVKL